MVSRSRICFVRASVLAAVFRDISACALQSHFCRSECFLFAIMEISAMGRCFKIHERIDADTSGRVERRDCVMAAPSAEAGGWNPEPCACSWQSFRLLAISLVATRASELAGSVPGPCELAVWLHRSPDASVFCSLGLFQVESKQTPLGAWQCWVCCSVTGWQLPPVFVETSEVVPAVCARAGGARGKNNFFERNPPKNSANPDGNGG